MSEEAAKLPTESCMGAPTLMVRQPILPPPIQPQIIGPCMVVPPELIEKPVEFQEKKPE